VLIPLDAELESTLTELLVAARPVEAEVERAVALLLVEDSPLDSDVTPL
jgi:hypothetical protein